MSNYEGNRESMRERDKKTNSQAKTAYLAICCIYAIEEEFGTVANVKNLSF